MKKIIGIVIGVFVVLLVLSVAKDALIKTSVEKGVEIVTGLRLGIQSFQVGLAKTVVGMKNLRLYNPGGYKDRVMLDMPEIYVDYDLPAVFRGKVHLEEMRMNMSEFTVVKNEKGELNLDSLKVVQEEKKPARSAGPKEKGKAPEIQIDSLELKIGKVVYKDYSKGGEPSVQEFNIGLDEKYKNINDPNKLVALIIVKALMNTTVDRLTGFDLSGLRGSVSDTLATGQKAMAEATAQAQKNVAETTTKAKAAAEKVKELVSSFFGK